MAVALALLAVVALASATELESDGALVISGAALIVLLLAVATAATLAVTTVSAGGYAAFRDTRGRTKLIAGMVGALLLTAVIAAMFISAPPVDEPPETGGPHGGTGRRTLERVSSRGFHDWADAVAGSALLGALLILLVALLLAERRRRRRRVSEPAVDEDEAVLEALDESIEDLRREQDVRRAIIACYARMERALDRAGSGRRPAEAPFEYLVRVLERITANGPAARTLTDLFERAKFSVEPMGEGEKQQAIDALELLRGEVTQPL